MSTTTTRRQALAYLASGAALAALAGCRSTRQGTTATTSGAPPAPPAPFAQPSVLTSADGRLAVTLTAAAGTVPYANGTRFALTYNGTAPGPTLRVRPGDQLVVTLVNRLDTETNLHTHGLHVSPSGGADNVFVMVPPGGSHTYTYDIPRDHRSGLCWYHPHVHGHVAEQIAGGLAGAIVIVDALDDEPAMAASVERLWVLSDPAIGTSDAVLSVSTMTRMQGREGDRLLVNGVAAPTVDATAGTLERWRLVNACASRYARVGVDGHDLHLVATDGGRLAAPVPTADVLLAPGERAEVLVAPTTAGTYAVHALPYDRGGAAMGGPAMGGAVRHTADEIIARLVVTGTAGAAALPARLADAATVLPPASGVARELVLAMGAGGGGMGNGGMGNGGGMSFTIDGRAFDPARTDISVARGAHETWTVRNTSTMDHPFHLHVWPFQVVGHEGRWKDTVNVPAGGAVTLRMAFTDLTGRTVYHCHILDHEDLGMMGIIEVT